jgi:pimeloyl-ACP methyl ester carboxylesterase
LFILINGHTLNVELHGPQAGPAVVLLHHGLGSVRSWKAQIPTLADAGYRVIVYDRWGYGGSDERPGLDVPSFLNDQADLLYLLDYFGIAHAALVGHSDGGTIALYFAVHRPGRVDSLVTVAAHIYVEAKMEPGILGIRNAFETDERFRLGLQYAHGEKFESVFDHWFDGWYRADSLNWDMRPLLNGISCPALIIQGDEDEHATPQHAINLASCIPDADLWLVPHVRHMLPQEAAAEFNTRLLMFLREQSNRVYGRG